MKEEELIEPVIKLFSDMGYRSRSNLDGGDFFDLVSIKGDGPWELIETELKVGDPRKVMMQAEQRLKYAEYVCIAMPSARSLQTAFTVPMRYKHLIGSILVEGDHAVMLKEPQRCNKFYPGWRDRIIGTFLAFEKGLKWAGADRPTESFVMWDTETMNGRRVTEVTRGWPEHIRKLVCGNFALELERMKREEMIKSCPRSDQTSLFSFARGP